MKKTNYLNSMVIAGALCLASAGWTEAQAQYIPNTQPEISRPTATMPAASQSIKMNKCSQLMGTTVENPQGQKLGKIDDVVVDFNNGRVSYCVLTVDHGLLASPKYLAVPLAAFQPSADRSHLILNANKDKVAQAKGFDRNNWPAVNNPAWGAEPFWQPAACPAKTAAH
jgi:sporulation protein YlmC with PRC-barrel domain